MGAAFLLLETKNVVQFALLFGTTWFVNALVFGGILSRCSWRSRSPACAVQGPAVPVRGAGVALAVAWLVPPIGLLQLSAARRFLAGTALAFTPVFIANLIFAQRFKKVGSSVVAFGANLLGAMVGGVLEYSALSSDTGSLLLVVAGLYALAFVSGRLVGPTAFDDASRQLVDPRTPSLWRAWASRDRREGPALSIPGRDLPEQAVCFVIRSGGEEQLVVRTGGAVVTELERPKAVDEDQPCRGCSADPPVPINRSPYWVNAWIKPSPKLPTSKSR